MSELQWRFAERAWLEDGWADRVLFGIDGERRIFDRQIGAMPPPDARRIGLLVPELPNLHSHAFQRGIVGRCERRASDGDDFWGWREQMYATALTLEPDTFEQRATQVYRELRAGGYGSVCEFHYLHHAPDGQPYDDPAELSLRLVRAAQTAGLSLTLLPVLYQRAGFDGAPARPEQRRFAMTLERYVALVEDLRSRLGDDENVQIGIAIHSLRAVDLPAIRALADWRRGTDVRMPLHVHVSEQRAEVDACVTTHGRTPIALLADTLGGLDAGVCLVHATHATTDELRLIADGGATVALCPTTEANLGDGLFPLPEFAALGGRWGIGSDSQVCRRAAAELRFAEYGQRLRLQRRCVLAGAGESTGIALLAAALRDKSAVCGGALQRLDIGAPLRALEFTDDAALDAWVFDEGPQLG